MWENLYSNRPTALRSLLTVSIISSYIYVSLRIYVRTRIIKTFGADDLFLLAILFTFSASTTTTLYAIHNGIGSSPNDIHTDSQLSSALYYWFLSELLFVVTIALLRIAACLHLRSLSKTSAQRYFIFAILGITVLSNGAYFLFSVQQCTPTQYFWTGWLGADGFCMDEHKAVAYTYIFSLVGGLSDVCLALLPIWLFWGEEMNCRIRNGRNVIMGLGLLAGTAALCRIPSTKSLLTSFDFFYECVPVAVCSILEPALGIIALSAAAFGGLDFGVWRRGNRRQVNRLIDFKAPVEYEKGMGVRTPPRAFKRSGSGFGV